MEWCKAHGISKKQLRGQRFSIDECRNCMMPNDITSKEDVLDPWAGKILERF